VNNTSQMIQAKLFATPQGMVSYTYQGVKSRFQTEYHSWHVVLKTLEGQILRTNQAFLLALGYEPDVEDALLLAEALVTQDHSDLQALAR
jgi:PAS domain-containing protein